MQGGNELTRDAVDVGISLLHLVVERVAGRESVSKPHAQPPKVLTEASAKLNVLCKRGMKPRSGFRHQMIDDWLVVGLRGEASVDELNESQKEFGDRRDVGVAEHETRLRLDRRGDPCGGRRDRVIDERAQLAAPHLGRVTCAYSPADDREVQRGDHRHGPAVVRGQELFGEDLAMRREVESRGELGEPAALGRLRGGAVWFDHLREELLSGHRFENKGEEPFADIELAAAHRDAHSGKALQVKVMSLEPRLRRSDIAAHRGPRRAEGFFEIGDVDRTRRLVEKCCEHTQLAVVSIENARTRDRAERRQERMSPVLVALNPHAHAPASHDPKALWAKVRVDRWQVVADDPTGQVELARDRLNCRWALLREEQPRDRRLSAIEWNDRHGGANLNFPSKTGVVVAVRQITVSEQVKGIPSAVRPTVNAARRMLKSVAPKAKEIAYKSSPPRSKSAMWKLAR